MKEYSKKYNKKAILLVNLGTPDSYSKKDVKKYLKQFLSDKRVIEANPILWWCILNLIILPIRSKKTAALYKKVWDKNSNKSPLLLHTQQQAEKLNTEFDDYIIDYAMRYGNPCIDSKIKELQQKGIIDITVLPLYPQYSGTTTASVFDDVYRTLSNLRWQPNISSIKPYYDNPHYIQAITAQIKEHIANLDYSADVVLLSFHGIPKQYFDAGDPYYCHCHKTYRLVKEALATELPNINIEMSFQSRFGPKKWLEPYTTDKLTKFAKADKSVVVIAPGFPADCLETLEELAIEERETFIENGGKNYSLISCLNSSDSHIQMFKNIILEK